MNIAFRGSSQNLHVFSHTGHLNGLRAFVPLSRSIFFHSYNSTAFGRREIILLKSVSTSGHIVLQLFFKSEASKRNWNWKCHLWSVTDLTSHASGQNPLVLLCAKVIYEA
jgi:hypothetical protein